MSRLELHRRYRLAFDVWQRRATASKVTPSYPCSPSISSTAHVIRRSSPGSRGRPGDPPVRSCVYGTFRIVTALRTPRVGLGVRVPFRSAGDLDLRAHSKV